MKTSRFLARRPGAHMQLPLTPMIDVTFQLLLFFLTATTWRQAEGQLLGSLPDPRRQVSQQAIRQLLKPLYIHLRTEAGGAVVYDLAGATFTQPQPLQQHLAALRQALGSDEVPVVIRPGWNVPWEHVVEAHNQVLKAQFRSVTLIPSR
jgi:biopolymer transport protein ExbD